MTILTVPDRDEYIRDINEIQARINELQAQIKHKERVLIDTCSVVIGDRIEANTERLKGQVFDVREVKVLYWNDTRGVALVKLRACGRTVGTDKAAFAEIEPAWGAQYERINNEELISP